MLLTLCGHRQQASKVTKFFRNLQFDLGYEKTYWIVDFVQVLSEQQTYLIEITTVVLGGGCFVIRPLSTFSGHINFSVKESGAQGQGIRTAYGLIPNYLEGEKAGSRTSDPSKEEGSDVINTENVKKEVNVKTELEEEVSF